LVHGKTRNGEVTQKVCKRQTGVKIVKIGITGETNRSRRKEAPGRNCNPLRELSKETEFAQKQEREKKPKNTRPLREDPKSRAHKS